MNKAPRTQRRTPRGGRQGNSQRERASALDQPPRDLASRLRGLYRRVAQQLGVDPSYVSRVARGERWSKLVDTALRRELKRIVQSASKARAGNDRKPPGSGRKE
jgi:hypothetical protein